MKAKRQRIRVASKPEIVSSTAFALKKNPNMYDNVTGYTPDPKFTEKRRQEAKAREKQAKFDDKWEQIKTAARNL